MEVEGVKVKTLDRRALPEVARGHGHDFSVPGLNTGTDYDRAPARMRCDKNEVFLHGRWGCHRGRRAGREGCQELPAVPGMKIQSLD